MASKPVSTFLFFHLAFAVVLALDVCYLQGNISVHPSDTEAVSHDFGHMKHIQPLAVLYPKSPQDIVNLVKQSYESKNPFPISPRGSGHSLYGQASVANGVVIDMKAYQPVMKEPVKGSKGSYVDVWGGDLWVNVLKWTLTYGLAPKSWTNYLHVTVGGTLSMAGIGVQSYIHGPQISNIYEMNVITGKGELVTCSHEKNSELFHSVLGGLGQFGIITRARIALEVAPESVVMIEFTYTDFTVFVKDMEYLISLHEKPVNGRFDSVGSSIFLDEGGPRYVMEVAKYFDQSIEDSIRQEIIEALLAKLDFIPSSISRTSMTYFDYLNQLRKVELEMINPVGLWDGPNPWVTLLVPKSKIADFNRDIFKGILTSSPNVWLYITIKPLNRNKWNVWTSVPIPNEDIFYAVLILRSAIDTGEGITATTNFIIDQNRQMKEFCKKNGLDVIEYLAYHETQGEWIGHYGDKWDLIHRRKMEFDPKHILATGTHIFPLSEETTSTHIEL